MCVTCYDKYRDVNSLQLAIAVCATDSPSHHPHHHTYTMCYLSSRKVLRLMFISLHHLLHNEICSFFLSFLCVCVSDKVYTLGNHYSSLFFCFISLNWGKFSAEGVFYHLFRESVCTRNNIFFLCLHNRNIFIVGETSSSYIGPAFCSIFLFFFSHIPVLSAIRALIMSTLSITLLSLSFYPVYSNLCFFYHWYLPGYWFKVLQVLCISHTIQWHQ